MLGAWGGSRGHHAGHCPWLPVLGLGQAEVDPLGSITYWLAGWSWIALRRDRCHCQSLPQQTPASPLEPHFALTFSPRRPAGPGAPCGKIRDLRGLAVPGNMHPRHGSSQLHSTTPTTLTHLSARWPWAPWGSRLTLQQRRERKVSWASCQPLPGWLLWGRVGVTPPCHSCPSTPTFSPSGPGTPRSPCRAKQRRVSGSLPPSTSHCPHPTHCPRPLRDSALNPIQAHWVVTAIPSHSHHRVSGTPGQCWSALAPSHLLARLSQLSWSPTVSLV